MEQINQATQIVVLSEVGRIGDVIKAVINRVEVEVALAYERKMERELQEFLRGCLGRDCIRFCVFYKLSACIFVA